MLVFGRGANIYWVWLPVIWGLELVFVLGLSLAFSALNIYIRDMRYVVESANTVLFWLVPIFYSFTLIPLRYREVYQFNPVAALVLMMRTILLDGQPPLRHTLLLMTLVSTFSFAVGLAIFQRLTKGFYEHL